MNGSWKTLVALCGAILGMALLSNPGGLVEWVAQWNPAWVQAWGSILAILASAGLVFLQHHLNRKRDRERAHEEKVARMRVVREVAKSTARNMKWLQERLGDRQAVHEVAAGQRYFPLDSIELLPNAISAIPIHELDSPTLVLEVRGVTMEARQMQAQMKWMLANHEKLDADLFEKAFSTFKQMVSGVNATVQRIDDHIGAVAVDPRAADRPGRD